MSKVLHHKVVAALPESLDPGSIYYVRKAAGFDIYITNNSGVVVAYEMNTAMLSEHGLPTDQSKLWAYRPGFGWRSIGDAPPEPVGKLPSLSGLNDTLNDEGESTSGWSAVGFDMGVTGGVLRATKTVGAGSGGQMSRPVTLPGNKRDYILYVKMRSNNGCVCWMANTAADKVVGVWLNSSDQGGYSPGTVAITGWLDNGTRTGATAAIYTDLAQEWLDVALHFDSKFKTLSCYTRNENGTWTFRARVACDHNDLSRLEIRALSTAPKGSWVEYDYITVSRPNLVVVGDSIAEGKSGFSPNPALSLTDYSNTWFAHCTAYAHLRNSLFVGLGVGAERSEQTAARSGEYTALGAKLIFVHASTNDLSSNTTLAQRTSNTQTIIAASVSSGANVVLLNSVYGTAANPFNPAARDYRNSWWTSDRLTLTGVDLSIDIMEPVRSVDNYMNATLTAADDIHLLSTGAKRVGEWVSAHA